MMFAPGGGLSRSQVCFLFSVSISTRIGTIHRSGSVAMACLYDRGMWCNVFISDKHAIMSLSFSWWSITIDAIGFLLSVAQSCPLSLPSNSRFWYSTDSRIALDNWAVQMALASSTIVRFIHTATPFCDGEYGAVG